MIHAGKSHVSPSPRRIAILLHDLGYCGAPRLALELARSLDPKRFDVQLWMLAMPADLAPLAVVHGVEIHWLGKGRRAGPRSLARLLTLLRAQRPELLYCLGPTANILGRFCGKMAGVPLVVGALRRSGDSWRQLEPVLWPLARKITTTAANLERVVPRRTASRLLRIVEGVDAKRFAPDTANLKDPAPRILCLGRLAREKGQEALLQAFALVLEKRPEARLMVVGNGSRRERLVSLARRLGVEARTQFLPARQDVAPLYHVAQIVAVPSLREGVPFVALEAMACGLPVVGADVGGMGEAVLDGETGLLVPPGNPRELAKALLRLLEDEPLRQRMGQAGRQRVQQAFDFRETLRAYEALFSALLFDGAVEGSPLTA